MNDVNEINEKNDIQDQINGFANSITAWNSSYEEYAKSVGLSYTGLSILCAVYDMENCTQKMICEKCFLPKQSVNSVITMFYKQGWIVLEEQPEDRRNKTISFTKAGRIYAEGVLARVHEAEKIAMGSLSQEQRAALVELTNKYVTMCGEAMKQLG